VSARVDEIRRVLARVEAGKRAIRVAAARWNRDPHRGWHAHVRAQRLAFIAEKRTEVLIGHVVPRTGLH